MLKHVLRIEVGACRRPVWHPGGRLLCLHTPQRGVVVDIDSHEMAAVETPVLWSPDGAHVLLQGAQKNPSWAAWPLPEHSHSLSPGRWVWLNPTTVGRVHREHLYCHSLENNQGEEILAKAPPGQRWVKLKGLANGGWAALRWDSDTQGLRLSTSRGKGWPVEHLRLPNMDGLMPRAWSWGPSEQSWLMLDHHTRSIFGWTFPQGLEWLQRPSRATDVCHTQAGAAWVEDEALLYWDTTSQELRAWDASKPITGLAWNPSRQWMAASSADGLDLIQLPA